MNVYLMDYVFVNFNTFLCFTCLALFLWYNWNRRKLYMLSWKYPGPLAPPIIGNFLQIYGLDINGITQHFAELGTDYPKMRRLWYAHKLTLSLANPEMISSVLNNPKCLHKPDLIYGIFKVLAGTGLFTAPVDIWKVHRKIINPTMNQKILNTFMVIFNEKAIIFTDLIKKHVGKGEFDIFEPMCLCTLDIICESTMGVKIDALNKGSDYLVTVQWLMHYKMEQMLHPIYRWDFIFERTKIGKQIRKKIEKPNEFVRKVVQEKKEVVRKRKTEQLINGHSSDDDLIPKRKAFLEYLVEEEKFTDQELIYHVHTMMIGGSDTSGTVLSFTCLTIAMHADVQEKIFVELDEIFEGSDRDVTCEDLSRLEYMERVIKETLRLFPITLGIMRETTDEIILDGNVVPAGVMIFSDILNMQRDATYWPDPLKFDPDRFLPEVASTRHPYAYIPFSSGTRNCIGLRFGMMSMKVVLATLLRNYKLTTSYKCIEDIKIEWHMIYKATDGSRVTLELRR